MEISFIVVGKSTAHYLLEGIEVYTRRLKHYIPFAIDYIPDVRKSKYLNQEEQKEAEGKAMLSMISSSDRLILLDERGKMFSSIEFSEFLQKNMASGLKRLVFAAGGPYGFSQSVYNRANGMVSLSRMTFNHEMVRLFFVEQVYRSMTILRGEPYHHE